MVSVLSNIKERSINKKEYENYPKVMLYGKVVGYSDILYYLLEHKLIRKGKTGYFSESGRNFL